MAVAAGAGNENAERRLQPTWRDEKKARVLVLDSHGDLYCTPNPNRCRHSILTRLLNICPDIVEKKSSGESMDDLVFNHFVIAKSLENEVFREIYVEHVVQLFVCATLSKYRKMVNGFKLGRDKHADYENVVVIVFDYRSVGICPKRFTHERRKAEQINNQIRKNHRTYNIALWKRLMNWKHISNEIQTQLGPNDNINADNFIVVGDKLQYDDDDNKIHNKSVLDVLTVLESFYTHSLEGEDAVLSIIGKLAYSNPNNSVIGCSIDTDFKYAARLLTNGISNLYILAPSTWSKNDKSNDDGVEDANIIVRGSKIDYSESNKIVAPIPPVYWGHANSSWSSWKGNKSRGNSYTDYNAYKNRSSDMTLVHVDEWVNNKDYKLDILRDSPIVDVSKVNTGLSKFISASFFEGILLGGDFNKNGMYSWGDRSVKKLLDAYSDSLPIVALTKTDSPKSNILSIPNYRYFGDCVVTETYYDIYILDMALNKPLVFIQNIWKFNVVCAKNKRHDPDKVNKNIVQNYLQRQQVGCGYSCIRDDEDKQDKSLLLHEACCNYIIGSLFLLIKMLWGSSTNLHYVKMYKNLVTKEYNCYLYYNSLFNVCKTLPLYQPKHKRVRYE